MTVPLDELRTLLEAATPRPWDTVMGTISGENNLVGETGRVEGWNPRWLDDAALIVAAVNHLDALIACAEAAEAFHRSVPERQRAPECHWPERDAVAAALAALSQGPSA